MVARQFIAWNVQKKTIRPVGNGMIGSTRRSWTLGYEFHLRIQRNATTAVAVAAAAAVAFGSDTTAQIAVPDY
jgi:hypothetical protein